MSSVRTWSGDSASASSDTERDRVLPLRAPATVLEVTVRYKDGEPDSCRVPWNGPITLGTTIKQFRELMTRDTGGFIESVTFTVTLERQP